MRDPRCTCDVPIAPGCEHLKDCPAALRTMVRPSSDTTGVHHLGWDEHARRGTRPPEAEDTTTSGGTW